MTVTKLCFQLTQIALILAHRLIFMQKREFCAPSRRGLLLPGPFCLAARRCQCPVPGLTPCAPGAQQRPTTEPYNTQRHCAR